ncbi:MAG: HEAT repeat domain-containing protein [Planctomycetes bacterium]|nr:HEAT repeat domain-containing protein [Planctomycetota bacterium]MCB9870124.1 HEAT repeat domain-containing protein [Planctomycetota bacterium]
MHGATPLLLFSLLAAALPAQIAWSPSLDRALEQAKAQQKVVYLVLHLDRERASDELLAHHYKDSGIVQLSRSTVNLFCSADLHRSSGTCPRCATGVCQDHRNNEHHVRRKIFKLEDDSIVVSPQHVFLDPTGAVISSATGALTIGELEWMMADAIRVTSPAFPFTPSGRTRAPVGFKKGAVVKTSQGQRPPTADQVKRALENAKKLASSGGGGGRGGRGGGRGGGGFGQRMQAAQRDAEVIIRSDSKKALEWGERTLRDYGFARGTLLRSIGKASPKNWFSVVAGLLDNKDDGTRRRAAAALEKLATHKALAPLRKQSRTEGEPAVLGHCLRAMAACGPVDRSVIAAVAKAAKSHKEEVARAHAVVAGGLLEDRQAVTQCLLGALQDPSAKVRSTAAYVIAVRQDRDLLDALRASTQAEGDAGTKDWMQKADLAVRGRDPSAFENFLAQQLEPAERGPGEGGGFGGRGRNGGGTGGGGTGGGDGGTGGGGGSGRGGRGRRGGSGRGGGSGSGSGAGSGLGEGRG